MRSAAAPLFVLPLSARSTVSARSAVSVLSAGRPGSC